MSIRTPFLILFAAISAFAHPHIFIDATANLIFDDNGLEGVLNTWKFDLIYSQAMIAAVDKDQNGIFDAAETAEFKKQIVDPAKQFSGFNYLGDGTIFFVPKGTKDLKASVKNGKLVIQFLNQFDIPVKSNDYTMLLLAVTDPTNYIQITIDMEKCEVKAPKSIDVEYFVDSLKGITLFKNFSANVKGLYVRYRKIQ